MTWTWKLWQTSPFSSQCSLRHFQNDSDRLYQKLDSTVFSFWLLFMQKSESKIISLCIFFSQFGHMLYEHHHKKKRSCSQYRQLFSFSHSTEELKRECQFDGERKHSNFTPILKFVTNPQIKVSILILYNHTIDSHNKTGWELGRLNKYTLLWIHCSQFWKCKVCKILFSIGWKIAESRALWPALIINMFSQWKARMKFLNSTLNADILQRQRNHLE